MEMKPRRAVERIPSLCSLYLVDDVLRLARTCRYGCLDSVWQNRAVRSVDLPARFVSLNPVLSVWADKYRFRAVVLAAKSSLTIRVKIQTLCLSLVLPSASSPERGCHAS